MSTGAPSQEVQTRNGERRLGSWLVTAGAVAAGLVLALQLKNYFVESYEKPDAQLKLLIDKNAAEIALIRTWILDHEKFASGRSSELRQQVENLIERVKILESRTFK